MLAVGLQASAAAASSALRNNSTSSPSRRVAQVKAPTWVRRRLCIGGGRGALRRATTAAWCGTPGKVTAVTARTLQFSATIREGAAKPSRTVHAGAGVGEALAMEDGPIENIESPMAILGHFDEDFVDELGLNDDDAEAIAQD